MDGGHFYTPPSEVSRCYLGQWQDVELDELFFDLFGNGWERYRGPFGIGKPRKPEFGRTWASEEYTGGLAEALDLYLSCDIDEEVYREQVERFKNKWLRKRTPRNRVDFYRSEFERTARDVMERMADELCGKVGEAE